MNIKKYLNPPEDICEAVKTLDMYYQITNQESIDLYIKKAHKKSFKGNIGDFFAIEDLKKYFKGQNDILGYMKQALHLLENLEDKIDTRLFSMVQGEELEKLMKIITDYPKEKEKVEKWLKPFFKNDSIQEAADDAVNIELDEFQYLELATLDKDHKSKKVSLFSNILQVDSIESLVNYLRVQKTYRDCFMLTVVRNKKRDWKSFFYMFLIYNGKLYSIDNSDQRANEDNTEGDRDPGRYLERKYENIWLPIHLLLDAKPEKTKALTVTDKGLYKIGSFDELQKKDPQYTLWISLFLTRVVEAIEKKNIKIEKGFMNTDVQKLLTSGKDKEYIAESVVPVSSGEYLLDVYKEVSSKEIMIKDTSVNLVVATKEHAQNVIAYKKRELQVKDIQKTVKDDYRKNHKKVYNKICKIILEQSKAKIIKKALEDKEYTYMYYGQFGTDYGIGPKPKGLKGVSELRKGKILNTHGWGSGEKDTEVFLGKDINKCFFHPQFNYKKRYTLVFKDWRQFIEFFGLKEGDIPIQMVQHLHQHSTLYTGNSILSDTDPLDRVFDPWFLEDKWYGRRSDDDPEYRVIFRLCGHCIKKLGQENK